MSTPLLPCPGCQRHVRITEASCPFCAGALSAAWARGAEARASRVGPGVRLSRAALFAAGALAISPAACGGDAEDDAGAGGSSTGGDANGTGGDNSVAVYGAPADGGADAGGAGGEQAAPEYGAAPIGTGGELAGPVYGLPPSD